MRRCVAVYMGSVLWSAVLHAALHRTQPLQPLHTLYIPFLGSRLSSLARSGKDALEDLCDDINALFTASKLQYPQDSYPGG